MQKSILLLSVVASLLSAPALSQTPPPRVATVGLTAPTKWEDGSNITGAITYNVYRGVCAGAKTKVVTGATTTTISVPASVAGQCFTATAVVDGSESVQSAEGKFRGVPGAPAVTVVVTIAVEVQ